jgi:xylulokinase
MALLLGVDVGTTSCKATVFDLDGCQLSTGSSTGTPVEFGEDGSAEQSAPALWYSARAAIVAAIAPLGPRPPVAAVGLCGAWTSVFARDGIPLDRAITWQDTRAREEAAWLTAEVGAAGMDEWLGLRLPISAALPAAKLLWLRRHQPDLLDGHVRVAQAKDLVGWNLTGRWATDFVSGICLVNPHMRRIAPDLLAKLGLPTTILPDLLAPSDVIGTVTEAATHATGLPVGIPVVCGIVDSWASLFGTGLFTPDAACDVTGTSEIVGLAAAATGPDTRGLLCFPLRDGSSVVYALITTGGDALAWCAEALFEGAGFPGFEAAAASAPPGADGMLFLPYLLGERSPVWDERVRAGFVAVDRAHRRGHFARATVEGLGHCVRQVLELAEDVAGTRATVLRASGGGARSTLVNQVKADILQRPVETLDVTETGTLGAAMLAGVGSGLLPDLADAAARMVRPAARFLPDRSLAALYDAAHRRYLALYPALRPLSP